MIIIMSEEDLRRHSTVDKTLEDLNVEHTKYGHRPVERADLVLLQQRFHGPFKVLKSRVPPINGQVLEYEAMMDVIQAHI